MSTIRNILVLAGLIILVVSCENATPHKEEQKMQKSITAEDILGNPDYLAISYGGYRMKSRDSQPTLKELKEDLRILHAMDIKVLRTYNVQLPHASNVLKAIRELKTEDTGFEMYVMLGAWIDCLNAWTDLEPDHNVESPDNAAEIDRAVALANEYPDVVKVLAVGNEAMVRWATSYYVQPEVILKWVTHLQDLKAKGKLSKELWITCSDDFASWGGGDESYHTEDLEKIMHAVDYISMHTYPYHNSHYNPDFWLVPEYQESLTKLQKIDSAMTRAKKFVINQYNAVSNHMKSLGIDKPIHIGETGWATTSNGYYGPDGSRATDEYKQALFYKYMREWTNANNISCFYFEAFDEPWKDSHNRLGSENHFGLFTVDGQAKYPLWDMVDRGLFKGLSRGGNPITKTYDGIEENLQLEVFPPPSRALIPVNH
ncbi:MAG: glycosyl hydrolase family 17 [Bacteroidia bacterium]|nr:glycosyl hydrolase family 17 [Bacteroidia bacterium]NNF31757.1 glycosyl hydrolase family 17 [Flavobacteriaceae bacterium]NNJ81346.1 glycosyl hydrolase family 17 [Flavobacteriaceae bacterium]NNK55271.1 glycosyl hydrolase family 17 [Flavobacteriaceae bacterium]NNM10266.1 glycosyl hydrolase family 17 [Flavobacteriaceae bacterium]